MIQLLFYALIFTYIALFSSLILYDRYDIQVLFVMASITYYFIGHFKHALTRSDFSLNENNYELEREYVVFGVVSLSLLSLTLFFMPSDIFDADGMFEVIMHIMTRFIFLLISFMLVSGVRAGIEYIGIEDASKRNLIVLSVVLVGLSLLLTLDHYRYTLYLSMMDYDFWLTLLLAALSVALLVAYDLNVNEEEDLDSTDKFLSGFLPILIYVVVTNDFLFLYLLSLLVSALMIFIYPIIHIGARGCIEFSNKFNVIIYLVLFIPGLFSIVMATKNVVENDLLVKSKTNRLLLRTDEPNGYIKILNIKPKYYYGMSLKNGKYHIEISKRGYRTERYWIEMDNADYREVLKFNYRQIYF